MHFALPLMVWVKDTATAANEILDMTCPRAWQNATGVNITKSSLLIGWLYTKENYVTQAGQSVAYGAKAPSEKLKQKLTARLGRPTVQETRQYTTPTRRCMTETKLQKGENFSFNYAGDRV